MMDLEKNLSFGENDVQTADIDTAGVVVLPVCYEHRPSYGTGTREGPFHILRASAQLECIDEEEFIDWSSRKIHTLPPLFPSEDPEQAVKQIQNAAEQVLARQKFLLSLGGDHAISIGTIKAAANIYPGIGVLQIDAHCDLRNEWNGSRFNHACVMRRVFEDMQLRIVPVGIRSFSAEEAEYIKANNIAPFYAHKIDPLDPAWITSVVAALPQEVYLSIDLDGLDPAVIPGTGTPEPGGLSYRQLVHLIKIVGRRRNVVAADITELVKIEGTQVSEFTAAKIATKIFVHCPKLS